MNEDIVTSIIVISIIILGVGLILHLHLISIERDKLDEIMYKELCQDERFYYLDSHAQMCYKIGVKP